MLISFIVDLQKQVSLQNILNLQAILAKGAGGVI